MTEPEAPPPAPRCGFIAVIGAPNAGKSTLVNAAVGAKVSIVTHKVQTTRFRVRGVALRGDAQIVFIDTPGIFAPKAGRRLERSMVAAAWAGAADADAVLVVVDAQRGMTEGVEAIVNGLKNAGRTAMLALNKVDAIKREMLLALAAEFDATGLFTDIFMISAKTGDGVADLLDHLAAMVPEGPWMFPADEVSDLPMRQMAAEITREEVFLQLHEELPYSTTVMTEGWEEQANGAVRVNQVIYLARDSQKGIVIGKQGSRLKRIGEKARLQMEEVFETRIHLFLHVKVQENLWDDREHYSEMGLDFDA